MEADSNRTNMPARMQTVRREKVTSLRIIAADSHSSCENITNVPRALDCANARRRPPNYRTLRVRSLTGSALLAGSVSFDHVVQSPRRRRWARCEKVRWNADLFLTRRAAILSLPSRALDGRD